MELLKQKNYNPLLVEEQFILLYAGLNGMFDNVDIKKIPQLETAILNEFDKFEFFDEEDNIQLIELDLRTSIEEIIKVYE
jgi:F0F1-type ATP synthase alpha subunit